MIEAFNKRFLLEMTKHDIARKAFNIERKILGLKGGQQDQYSATFGGFNYIYFRKDGRVDINPLKIDDEIICEFEASLILSYTGISRDSGKIIEAQIKKDESGDLNFIENLNKIKNLANKMKIALNKKSIVTFGDLLHQSWIIKRKFSQMITNEKIDNIYKYAKTLGAYGGKSLEQEEVDFLPLFAIQKIKEIL